MQICQPHILLVEVLEIQAQTASKTSVELSFAEAEEQEEEMAAQTRSAFVLKS